MYGEGRNWRYIIGFGLVIVLLFFIIYFIVHSGSGKSGKVPETKQALTSYADNPNITVQETIIGPITSPQTHNEATISVSNSTTSMQVMQGYDGNVVKSKDYPMTSASFSEFLNALDKAGYTLGNTDSALKNDAGYCASGQRYIFEIKDGGNTVQRFWATNCRGTKTYKGNLSQTLSLFNVQVPDANDLLQDTSLSSGGLSL